MRYEPRCPACGWRLEFVPGPPYGNGSRWNGRCWNTHCKLAGREIHPSGPQAATPDYDPDGGYVPLGTYRKPT